MGSSLQCIPQSSPPLLPGGACLADNVLCFAFVIMVKASICYKRRFFVLAFLNSGKPLVYIHIPESVLVGIVGTFIAESVRQSRGEPVDFLQQELRGELLVFFQCRCSDNHDTQICP